MILLFFDLNFLYFYFLISLTSFFSISGLFSISFSSIFSFISSFSSTCSSTFSFSFSFSLLCSFLWALCGFSFFSSVFAFNNSSDIFSFFCFLFFPLGFSFFSWVIFSSCLTSFFVSLGSFTSSFCGSSWGSSFFLSSSKKFSSSNSFSITFTFLSFLNLFPFYLLGEK